MATTHVSSLSKTEVYQSLYLISQATQQLAEQLDRLMAANVVGHVSGEINKAIALQLRAEIATSAVHNLASREIDEAHRQETKRIRLERRQAQAGTKTKSRR